jgi:hypothetical protein
MLIVGLTTLTSSSHLGDSPRTRLFDGLHRLARLRPSTGPAESCGALWQQNSEYRRVIYRLDAILNDAQYHATQITGQVANYNLDVNLSLERLMTTVGPRMRDMMQALDEYHSPGGSDRRFFREVFSRTGNGDVIHEFQSVVRLLQDPVSDHVPLYSACPFFGISDMASYIARPELLTSLRRVRTVVLRGTEEQKRVYLDGLMYTVREMIGMLTKAPNHLVGEELRSQETHAYFNPSITSPRSCRLSGDPVARIERLTREFFESMDFCRGLLFRFVPRDTRDRWMDNFHELYDLFEQLLVGQQESPYHNVRLGWFRRQPNGNRYNSPVVFMFSIRDIYDRRSFGPYFSCDELNAMKTNFESILRNIENRSSMGIGSLRSEIEIDTRNSSVRDRVGEFLATVEALFRGRQYLTVEEAEVVTHSARVAYTYINIRLRDYPIRTTAPVLTHRAITTTTPRPTESNNTPFWSPEHEFTTPRMEWTMAEVQGIVGHMGRGADRSFLLGRASDRSIDDLEVTPAHLRRIMFYPDELVVAKFIQLGLRFHIETTLEITAGVPDRMSQLISYWETYSGPDSARYLEVLLRVSDLTRNSVMLSAFLMRVFKGNEVSRIENLAHAIFLRGAHISTWTYLTKEATSAISKFWATRDRDVTRLSRIALSPVDSEYCARFRYAMASLDSIRDASLRNAAIGFLLSICPNLRNLAERALVFRENTRRVQHVISNRAQILVGAAYWFNSKDGTEIRSGRIQVSFLGEDGSDAGGLRREWFYLLGRQIVDNGLMIETEPNSGRLLPNTTGENKMEFVGKFIGKAIRDGQTVPIRFAKVIYRYILEGLDNVRLDLGMYTEQSPDHARALRWLLKNDESSEEWDEATRDLSFSVDIVERGVHRVHDLIDGGSNVLVVQENKREYVQRVIEFKMREAFRPQLESFFAGFSAVLPRDDYWVERFTPDELEIIIAGRPELDVADLRVHTTYIRYSETDQQIVWFWEVVENFDQDQLALLLQFSSGTPLAPVEGFASLPLKIVRVGIHPNPANNPLPSAHTCLNQLQLPAYISKEELEEKLVRSITIGSEGFGFV